MIDERMEAIQMVKQEADKLRMVCVAMAGVGAILHIAYDRELDEHWRPYDALLMTALSRVP